MTSGPETLAGSGSPMLLTDWLGQGEPVGSGGTSVVYRVHHPATDMTFALKVFDCSDGREIAEERALSELVATQGLIGVPGVCMPLCADLSGDSPVIAFHYFPGGSLLDQLTSQPLEVPRVLDLGARIAAVLASIHHLGSDLSLANLYVSKSGQPMLSDFGGADGFTPRFAAPEIAQGAKPSSAADVWALGVVLLELSCGLLSDDRATGEGGESNVPIRSMLGDAPEMVPILDGVFEPDPGRRPSALQVLQRLRRAQVAFGHLPCQPAVVPTLRLPEVNDNSSIEEFKRILTSRMLMAAFASTTIALVLERTVV